MELPVLFEERMRRMLPPEEYEQFLKSYEREQYHALRVNTLKIRRKEFLERGLFDLEPVPWCENGFYYGENERPGKHPFHEAGLYYIQEPSAMSAAALADVQPGEYVLDLCAAPGGKSTQLASALQGQGLLVANEIHPARAKILSQNIERMGVHNALVTNETPQSLALRFPAFFDRIIVDAPCSGEGMFFKEEQALIHWSPENVQMCASRQDEILEEAAKMLAPGGTLVYSTCTFAPEEDEGSMVRFLTAHPEFSVKKVPSPEGFRPGHPEWVDGPEELKATFRLWPHVLKGEGHYAAVLQKAGELPEHASFGKVPKADRAVCRAWEEFAAVNLRETPEGIPVLFGEQLYLLPVAIPLKGLKVLRPGLHVGTWKKNRLEPAHALAMVLRAQEAARSLELHPNPDESWDMVSAWLRGESVPADGENGWTLALAEGYPIGWGKVSGGQLKNHYPKGLRR